MMMMDAEHTTVLQNEQQEKQGRPFLLLSALCQVSFDKSRILNHN